MLSKKFTAHARGKIRHGQLIKAGLRYDMRYLDHADVRDSLALQTHVVDVLKAMGKNHYVIPKSEEKLRRLIDDGHALIGIFVKENKLSFKSRLVAHMLVVYPCTADEAGLSNDNVLPDKNPRTVSVVANILVHQDYRGNRLMQHMLDEWLKLTQREGKKHAVAEASIDNEFSWGVFLESGFVIYDAGYDPRDGSNSFYLHKPLDRAFAYGSAPEETIMLRLFDSDGTVNSSVYEEIKRLLQQGFHALEFNRRTKDLVLRKCTGYAPEPFLQKSPGSPLNDNRPG